MGVRWREGDAHRATGLTLAERGPRKRHNVQSRAQPSWMPDAGELWWLDVNVFSPHPKRTRKSAAEVRIAPLGVERLVHAEDAARPAADGRCRCWPPVRADGKDALALVACSRPKVHPRLKAGAVPKRVVQCAALSKSKP